MLGECVTSVHDLGWKDIESTTKTINAILQNKGIQTSAIKKSFATIDNYSFSFINHFPLFRLFLQNENGDCQMRVVLCPYMVRDGES